MTAVRVRIPTPLRPHTEGRDELTVAATSVGGMLDALAATHPSLVQQLRTRDGQVRPYVNIFVGQTDIRASGGLDTPLSDGDEVIIMPSVAGG